MAAFIYWASVHILPDLYSQVTLWDRCTMWPFQLDRLQPSSLWPSLTMPYWRKKSCSTLPILWLFSLLNPTTLCLREQVKWPVGQPMGPQQSTTQWWWIQWMGVQLFLTLVRIYTLPLDVGVRLNQNISAAIIYIEDNGESEGSHHWRATLL